MDNCDAVDVDDEEISPPLATLTGKSFTTIIFNNEISRLLEFGSPIASSPVCYYVQVPCLQLRWSLSPSPQLGFYIRAALLNKQRIHLCITPIPTSGLLHKVAASMKHIIIILSISRDLR